MKSILILTYSDLHHDARVVRQINFLKEQYQVTVVCFDAPANIGVEVILIKKIKPGFQQKVIVTAFLVSRLFEKAYTALYDFPELRKQLQPRTFNLIVANDIESLPLAFKIRKQEKIVFDAHEYAPRHFEDKFVWRLLFQPFNQYLCRAYLHQVDGMMTVGEGLAREYSRHYPVTPVIVTNANYFTELEPKPVNPNTIRLIHHGAANPSRQLELMLDLMNHLDDRFTLDLMLLVPTLANKKTRSYLDTLKKRVEGNPKIRIIPPVQSHAVVNFIHEYDMGIFLLPPINFNYANTLPNKLFDFIQARLAIAIGPTPEMAHLVTTHHLGVVSENFHPESLAAQINSLTADHIFEFKKNSDQAAHLLSAETNKVILQNLVAKLLN